MQLHSDYSLNSRRRIANVVLALAMLAGLILAGCGSPATPAPTATVVPSPTPYPTYTPFPTLTPAPTYTPYPTQTPAPIQIQVKIITQTPNPTYTPYPTFTPYLTPTVPPSPTPAGPTIYSWQEAGQHIGEYAAIEGTIVRTYNSGKVIFLNFAEEYQGTFTVVIFADDAGKFPQPPEQLFLNQYIRVVGEIGEYKGAPQIVVNEPAQIEVVRR
ncbi:MAG: OB-fold nucleic acid binding domain-containing protein [Anaerolineae bacterium]